MIDFSFSVLLLQCVHICLDYITVCLLKLLILCTIDLRGVVSIDWFNLSMENQRITLNESHTLVLIFSFLNLALMRHTYSLSSSVDASAASVMMVSSSLRFRWPCDGSLVTVGINIFRKLWQELYFSRFIGCLHRFIVTLTVPDVLARS